MLACPEETTRKKLSVFVTWCLVVLILGCVVCHLPPTHSRWCVCGGWGGDRAGAGAGAWMGVV